jgi:Flp pilus assembly protein TadG
MFFDLPEPRPPRISATCRAFGPSQSGSVAIIFALAIPALIGAAALAIDYSVAVMTKSRMQAVADSAALISAREWQMAKATRDTVAAVARSYVMTRFNDVTADVQPDQTALSVRVTLDKDVDMTLGKVLWNRKMHVRVSSTAQVSASLPLCLLALDGRAPGTIALEQSAQLTATGCMLYSDSTARAGLHAKNDAVVTAALTCSAGGVVKSGKARFTPDPAVDCPNMDDPLSSRTPPDVGGCNYTETVVKDGTQLLRPGVYCKGLTVTDGAEATLAPGIYIIKDGPLVVDKGATLQGAGVALYLKGSGANLTFDTASTINLSAPKDGPLAGMLIFDDPSGAPASAVPPVALPDSLSGKGGPPREHKILSDNARLLLGTIYMPQGRLIIDATKPIADKSAYTVLVVRRLDLHNGPNLVLNSDYSASEVPVPVGVGPIGQVSLTQ